jgi:hypothetical protein
VQGPSGLSRSALSLARAEWSGVYPQCVPSGGALPHMLEWSVADEPRFDSVHSVLTRGELGVLEDAAAGLTVHESAKSRGKSSEPSSRSAKRCWSSSAPGTPCTP